uniref:protein MICRORCHIDIA 6-like isoform X2 n=1 Tax=Erigeron canadensis TaxID=72917 RepID=UPI001CB9318C|nr:protein MICRORCHIDIA 6-like isoform X2 [Erigeron canadensis]
MDANAVKLEPNLYGISDQLKQPDVDLRSTSPVCKAPIIRQFWKAGAYDTEFTSKAATQSGSTYLHIHPRFLHSNATSHKWVFGAVAELIDNAVDEIQYGATYVYIDKTSNPRNGTSALLIQDDGNGMDPQAMRRCLSFGFSDKSSISTIGKYGNGFKTSSMRLGADVIVFSRSVIGRKMTQSIGLLSYTFLTREGYDRIVVPMVHYELNYVTGSFDFLQSDNFNLNLSMLLQWSPYSTQEKLLEQFEDIGPHGTKVIVYNLWLDKDGTMELDFDSEPEDIRITRDALGKMKDGTRQEASERHIANQLRYSLRAYLSILYLKLPETFAIVLRGKTVLYHNVATDLKYPEYIMYRTPEGPIVTTIGFVKEAPRVNVHGFNVYHKNRLILPYCPMVSFSGNRGRGVVGILEANFIEPTHDKQDFEKTSIFQKLKHRLKEMTWEYWDYHCGLIGYKFITKPRPPSATPGASNFVYQHGTEQNVPMRKYYGAGGSTRKPPMITSINTKAAFESKSLPKPVEPFISRGFQDEGSNLKRKSSVQPTMLKSKPRMEVDANKGVDLPGLVNSREAAQVFKENRKLRAQCAEYEKAEEQLKVKVMQLKMELGIAQKEYAHVLAELQDLQK